MFVTSVYWTAPIPWTLVPAGYVLSCSAQCIEIVRRSAVSCLIFPGTPVFVICIFAWGSLDRLGETSPRWTVSNLSKKLSFALFKATIKHRSRFLVKLSIHKDRCVKHQRFSHILSYTRTYTHTQTQRYKNTLMKSKEKSHIHVHIIQQMIINVFGRIEADRYLVMYALFGCACLWSLIPAISIDCFPWPILLLMKA